MVLKSQHIRGTTKWRPLIKYCNFKWNIPPNNAPYGRITTFSFDERIVVSLWNYLTFSVALERGRRKGRGMGLL